MLESLGMVEVRPGVDAIVTHQAPRSLDTARYLLTHPAKTLEVIEVRETLVMLSGELAAQRITQNELTQLELIVRAQDVAFEDHKHEELARLDEQFHSQIFRAARNGVLSAMESSSRAMLDNVQWNVLTLATRMSASIEEHRLILDAIRSRDVDAAGTTSRAHARRSLAGLRQMAMDKLADL
jgi:GntR family transcriptional regulator, transcriptional repressor for pyruvate dehydrogenase complex